MQRCWEVIDAQAEEALTSDGFADIDFDTLQTVLARYTARAFTSLPLSKKDSLTAIWLDFSSNTNCLAWFFRETLNAQEKVIFESACRWAEAECGREEVEATPENQRKVLGEALLLLRIPAMSLEGNVWFKGKGGEAKIDVLFDRTDYLSVICYWLSSRHHSDFCAYERVLYWTLTSPLFH